jgi:peptidyl-prolyl cis-trans isomerase D
MAKINVKEIVSDRLIQDSVLSQALEKLNIVVPQKSLIRIVHSLPEFQNRGSFDARIYETAMRRAGISEARFLTQIRESIARTQLIHPIAAGYKFPEFVKEIICKEFEAKNTVLVARLKVDSMKNTEVPTDDALRQFYSNSPDKYKKPEIRDVAILVIDYGKLAESVSIDEDELNRHYEEIKDSYAPKEKRNFERFSFESGEDANKAWQMLNKGAKTKTISVKFAARVEAINNCETSDFSENIGRELFNLKLNKTSRVYKVGDFYYVYRLTAVEKGKRKSEAEVKEEIKRELQSEKLNSPEFYSKTKETRDKIDDGFGAGKSIEEIAKETGMEIVEIKNFAKSANNSELEKLIPDEDTREEVKETIFSTEELQASSTIASRASDTISYVAFVRKVETAAVPEFEKVAAQVKKDFIFEQKGKVASQRINEIVSKNVEASKEVSKMAGVKRFRFSKKDLIMNEKHHYKDVDEMLKEIPNINLVLDIVSTLKKGEANYYKVSEEEYILVSIENIEKTQKVAPEFKEVIDRYLDLGVANDVPPLIIMAFKHKANIKINQKLLDQITKRDDERESNN